MTTTAEALAEFEAQGAIQPGTPGWWKVWGARPQHIRKGDLLLLPENGTELIADTFVAKAAPLRFGFVNAEGDRFTIGALAPIVLLRRSDHNVLA